jgi:hypothetical protein
VPAAQLPTTHYIHAAYTSSSSLCCVRHTKAESNASYNLAALPMPATDTDGDSPASLGNGCTRSTRLGALCPAHD